MSFDYVTEYDKAAQQNADLMTCLDFCDAMGEEIIRPPKGRDDRYGYQGLAIRHAAALARQMMSGEWHDYSQIWAELADWQKRGINEDVRRRMADLIKRLEVRE